MRHVRELLLGMVAGIVVGSLALPCRAGVGAGGGDESNEHRLLEAVRGNDATKVAELLKAGADPKAVEDKRGTIVESAIRYGNAAVLKAMVAGGVDLKNDVEGLNHWSPLEYVLLRTDASVETIKYLLEAGTKLKEIEWIWMPPCMTRAAVHNSEIMRLLLEAGADPNDQSKGGEWSCLDFAICTGSPGSVRALLDAGADASRKDKNRRSVWHKLAARYLPDGAGEIATALKEKGAGSPDATDRASWTPLGLAAYASATDSIRALVAVGADVNKAGPGGQTPLIQAALSGNAATMRMLLELKADPNKADASGATPLYWAISSADPSALVRWTSRKSKGDDQRPVREGSVWEQIERSDPVGKVKALLDAGADANRSGTESWSPLALAAFMWDESSFGWGGRDEESTQPKESRHSPSAVRFYREHDPMEIIRPLIAAGAVRVRAGEMTDPLDVAAQRGDLHRAAMIEAISKLKAVDDEGGAPVKKKPSPARPKF